MHYYMFITIPILMLDTIMKLSGTIGVTQKTMTLDTHVRLISLQTLNPQER